MAAQDASAIVAEPYPAREPTKSTTLTLLPTELLQMLADLLPNSSQIALKLTSRALFLRLPTPLSTDKTAMSPCELKATRRYVSEQAEAVGGRRRCVLCGGLMLLAFFREGETPVCRWHDGWFGKVADVEHLAEMQLEVQMTGGEARVKRLLCVHCKKVRAWDIEPCLCETQSGCASCGVFEVECCVQVAGGSVIMGWSR